MIRGGKFYAQYDPRRQLKDMPWRSRQAAWKNVQLVRRDGGSSVYFVVLHKRWRFTAHREELLIPDHEFNAWLVTLKVMEAVR